MKIFAWDLIHPVARGQFMALDNDLAVAWKEGAAPCLFRPFEGWRSPEKQLEAYKRKVSKSLPWQSAHQYGLAIDFVPYVNGRWSWEPEAGDQAWHFLRLFATRRGLVNDISWDRPHVQHPAFADLKAALWGDPPSMAA